MPMSPEAMEGLRVAVAWNPDAAVDLLGILREAPGWVKYKPDPYGPLHLMLNPLIHQRRIAEGISVSVKPPPFPDDKRPAFEAFGKEWLARRFSKQELAETIAQMLTELGKPPPDEQPHLMPIYSARESDKRGG